MDRKRITEIDLARSMAIIAMIIFHFFFILNFYDIADFNTNEGIFWFLGYFARITFIGLVGVSLAISTNDSSQIKRRIFQGMKVFLAGCLVTVATYIVLPGDFVRFGILHMLGLGIIVFAPIAQKKYLALVLSILILLLSLFLKDLNFFTIIGGTDFRSIDYFPILPWFSLIAFGVYLGNIIKNHHSKNLQIPYILTFLSKNSLIIYLLHVPLIIFLFICLRFLPK